MHWIKVTKENLPGKEVLALNYMKNTYGFKEKLLGYIYVDDESTSGFACEDEGQILQSVTHFIDPDSIPFPEEKENGG